MANIEKMLWISIVWLVTAVLANSSNTNTYDYIIVGSGPGGGTLAANLAKAGESVLLLEAGDDQGENPNELIAGFFPFASSDPTMRWDFFVKHHTNDTLDSEYDYITWRTTDGKFYVGQNPPPGATKLGVYYPRAGTLGGCSTHNAMCAVLPSNSDWDNIAAITGDNSWSAANMRQYFIMLENDHVVPKGTPGHGFNGFLDMTANPTDFLKNQTQATEVLQAAAVTFGQDPSKIFDIVTKTDLNNNDPNRDQQQGLFAFPAHRDPLGRRVSARDAVVEVWNATKPDGSQKYPLTVSLYSLATKILFSTSKTGKAPQATGVEYLYGESMYSADPRYNASNPGIKKTAIARKEVIVSGGVFNSPQLLQLSGIGPASDLRALNIPVLVNLPGVGANIQDNSEMGVAAASTKENFTSIGPICTYGAPGDPCLAAWQVGKGPYATGPLDAVMYKTSQATERDLIMFGLPGGVFRGYWPSDTVNVVPGELPSNFDFSMVKIHPHSRGIFKLKSNNPRDTPAINLRMFEGAGADIDLQSLSDGADWGRKVFAELAKENSPLAPLVETSPCRNGIGCNVKETIRTQAWSHHATSSCAIGSDNDPLAVLDSKFRVRGVTGLRVVDGSAFPSTPGGFPVIPTFMLSMKASDVILQDKNNW